MHLENIYGIVGFETHEIEITLIRANQIKIIYAICRLVKFMALNGMCLLPHYPNSKHVYMLNGGLIS